MVRRCPLRYLLHWRLWHRCDGFGGDRRRALQGWVDDVHEWCMHHAHGSLAPGGTLLLGGSGTGAVCRRCMGTFLVDLKAELLRKVPVLPVPAGVLEWLPQSLLLPSCSIFPLSPFPNPPTPTPTPAAQPVALGPPPCILPASQIILLPRTHTLTTGAFCNRPPLRGAAACSACTCGACSTVPQGGQPPRPPPPPVAWPRLECRGAGAAEGGDEGSYPCTRHSGSCLRVSLGCWGLEWGK